MASLATIDLQQVARQLGLPASRVETVVELLDAGNTVPFITRYRKDQTGGLDEEQIRQVQSLVSKLRLLAERKQVILRSIDSQGKLTPQLAEAIEAAQTTRRLEDLYLPYKPKKQTLATAARERGLEPLADEIMRADPACADLDARAADFINIDRKVMTAADALLGAGHILAERFSERADLRGRLREIFERTGQLVSIGQEELEEPKTTAASEPRAESGQEGQRAESGEPSAGEASAEADSAGAAMLPEELVPADDVATPPSATLPSATSPPTAPSPDGESAVVHALAGEPAVVDQPSADAQADQPLAAPDEQAATPAAPPAPAAPKKKRAKKEKKAPAKKGPDFKAFRDYFNYREPLGQVPPHRVLAINRGERAKALRVRVEVDFEAMQRLADELLVPAEHPHADFLRGCGRDALNRLILPSLEREFRRELTDRAELHAVEVFVRNLRNLLLQPPVRDRRVLAVDPGFKSGCKIVAIDEFGRPLGHDVIFLVGSEQKRAEARTKTVNLVREHACRVAAIGNGTGCREAERFISELIAGELADASIAYVITNEAGASVYSTSRLGREEFPNHDATLRGAISIGRRLQDPLSELVKIDPASIGVGMYQHDVKARHLRDSLDAVVESCVNFVGCDLNTASPSLLRYVSGLNQPTAQRVYDFRATKGPLGSREQLKEVPGFGESTFVQAAGFLKIVGGNNPLDATWIHPESYGVAEQVLARAGATPADLTDKQKLPELEGRIKALPLEQLARELNVGELTLRDIVAQLTRPGRDPREELPPPFFKQGVLKIEDVQSGMELTGTVLNVVDFGAFVDIGLKDSGLVHVSQLADRYVKDPHEVVAVGDIVKVWVLEVDKQRRRVSLTMVDPAKRQERREAERQRQAEKQRAAQQQRSAQQQRPQQQQRSGGEGQQGRGRRDGKQRHDQRRGGGGERPPKTIVVTAKKPKVVAPLTKKKAEGKAPLQTFGELAQFFNQKKADEPPASDAPAES